MLVEQIERDIELSRGDPPFTGRWAALISALLFLSLIVYSPLSSSSGPVGELFWLVALIWTGLIPIYWLIVSLYRYVRQEVRAYREKRQGPLLTWTPDDTGKGDWLLCAKLGRVVYYTDARADGPASAWIAMRDPVYGNKDDLVGIGRTPKQAREICEAHARTLPPRWCEHVTGPSANATKPS